MKTPFIFLFSFLFVCSLHAQVTNFGTLSGTLGQGSSFFGYAAGNLNTATGTDNSFVGFKAGSANTTGVDGTFLGAYAGGSNKSGKYNTFVGKESGYNSSTSNYNTFVGMRSGYAISTGNYNTFIGNNAGRLTSTGSGNVALGYGAGESQKTIRNNTYIGQFAGTNLTSGGENVFVGKGAAQAMVTGKYNAYLGANAGGSNYGGSGNVFLGNAAGYQESSSNKLYIENSKAATPLIYGDFKSRLVGINTKQIPDGYTLAVNGKIITEEVRVQLVANWPDYVFNSDYELMPLEELRKYIDENKHLPEVPSAQEINEQGGQDLAEMDRLLLKKVEELSLYVLQLQAEIEELKKK